MKITDIKDLENTLEAIEFALELIGDPITVWSTSSTAEIERVTTTFKMMRVAYQLLKRSAAQDTTFRGRIERDSLEIWTDSQYEASGQ